jgi:hypothetical protein
MRAEAVWRRYHRGIIADDLIAVGEIVFYVLNIEPARVIDADKPRPDGSLTCADLRH